MSVPPDLRFLAGRKPVGSKPCLRRRFGHTVRAKAAATTVVAKKE
jgi:hypothetical protein